KNATKDPHIIQSWWQQYPEANVGGAMGDVSQAFTIDLDGTAAWKTLNDLRAANSSPLLKTLISQTGRGADGQHLIYDLPSGVRISCVSRKDLGVDIIGTNGYIVLPPSNHISGGVYKWVRDDPIAIPEPWLMNWVFSLFDRGLQKAHQSPVSLDLPGAPPPGFKSCERPADRLSEGLSAPSPAPPWREHEDAKLRSALDYLDSHDR